LRRPWFQGREAQRAESCDQEAFKIDGPAIIDAVAVANELPNLPHIALETVGRYAMAKLKEAVLAVTGS